MKVERQITIISGFMGFAIGVCSMMAINIDKEIRQAERFDETKFTIQENINTCEDMIEWMNYDIENYADSTVFDSYIWNLNDMIEDNRYILQTKYDY
jgi:hypothetical protein